MNKILLRSGIYSYCLFLMVYNVSAQTDMKPDSIHLINASFEDTPKQSSPPMGWTDCGFQGESAPAKPGRYRVKAPLDPDNVPSPDKVTQFAVGVPESSKDLGRFRCIEDHG